MLGIRAELIQTYSERKSERGGCAVFGNYSGSGLCFIECERADPVTNPPHLPEACLTGGRKGQRAAATGPVSVARHHSLLDSFQESKRTF